jgi:hypothetical protein
LKCVIARSPLDKRHNTNKNNRNCTPSSSFMTKRHMTLFVDINIYIMYTFLWQIFSFLEQTDLMVDSWIDLLHVSSTKASSETRDKTCVEIGNQNLIFHWNLRLFEGHYLCVYSSDQSVPIGVLFMSIVVYRCNHDGPTLVSQPDLFRSQLSKRSPQRSLQLLTELNTWK